MSFLVTFEGIDGSGKTTQINILSERVKEEGIRFLTLREPGSTAIGEKVREILLSPESSEMSMTTELLLYSSARAQLTAEVIKPALERGETVFCDRFTDSTLAYQGYGNGYDINAIKFLNKEATGGLFPQLTFIFDIEVKESFRRCKIKEGLTGDKDRIESRDEKYYGRVREGYIEIARSEPQRVVLIPAGLSVEKVAAIIRENFYGRLRGGF